MAPPGTGSVCTWSKLMVWQARAIESVNLIAFASISLAPSNLNEDSKAPGRRPYWRRYWLRDQRLITPIDGGGHGIFIDTSFVTYRYVRIAAAIQRERRLFLWLVAHDFTSQHHKKTSVLPPFVAVPSGGLEPQESHHLRGTCYPLD